MAIVKWRYVANWVCICRGIIFLILTVLIYLAKITNGIVGFLIGVMACMFVIGLVTNWDRNRQQNKLFKFLSRYTMPIFLMHTLFAAPLRSVLLKVDISNSMIHVISGIMISFAGPIVATEIMKKTKILEFFLYPGKFIKIK